jgi:ABC-type multidrug transport system ATPase subunit
MVDRRTGGGGAVTGLAASLPVHLTGPSAVAAADVAVSIRGLSKRFVVRRTLREILRRPFDWTYQQAVNGVECDVLAGEFFGLLGPNGAGKTTLFKMLATFVTPDSGTAIVCGADLRQEPGVVRRLVTPAVADERSLRWRLTARENLKLFATLYDVPHRELDSRVDELLAAVGLSETNNKLVGQFSTGMKQRLVIARALIPRPRLLLLDEPTRGLDPLLARSFRGFLREEIGRRQGCTVMLATHNAEEAFELCDRVAILDRGHLRAVGSAGQLREEFGHQRYHIWTRTPDHRSFADLTRLDIVRIGSEPATDDGWTIVEVELTGGTERAAEAMHHLVAGGAVVARFERVSTSLADLIERVVQRAGKEAKNA